MARICSVVWQFVAFAYQGSSAKDRRYLGKLIYIKCQTCLIIGILYIIELYVLSRFLRKKRDIFATFICKICCKNAGCYLLKALIILLFSLLPSVERRSNEIPAFFSTESFNMSRLDCSDPALWKAIPSTSIASTGCFVVLL